MATLKLSGQQWLACQCNALILGLIFYMMCVMVILIDLSAAVPELKRVRPEALWRGFNAPCTLMPCAMEGFIARVRV